MQLLALVLASLLSVSALTPLLDLSAYVSFNVWETRYNYARHECHLHPDTPTNPLRLALHVGLAEPSPYFRHLVSKILIRDWGLLTVHCHISRHDLRQFLPHMIVDHLDWAPSEGAGPLLLTEVFYGMPYDPVLVVQFLHGQVEVPPFMIRRAAHRWHELVDHEWNMHGAGFPPHLKKAVMALKGSSMHSYEAPAVGLVVSLLWACVQPDTEGKPGVGPLAYLAVAWLQTQGSSAHIEGNEIRVGSHSWPYRVPTDLPPPVQV